MTLEQRCAAHNRAYGKWPASHARVVKEDGRDVIYALWVIGNDYRNPSKLYGAYPHGFLARLLALFPDCGATNVRDILHVFSGSLEDGPYRRLDLHKRFTGDEAGFTRGSVYDAPSIFAGEAFGLVIADPPYTRLDAEKYGTPGVNRGRAMRAIAEVTQAGGHLAWLDTVWPMHNKRQWLTVGRITVVRSTNHRVRLLTIFERKVDMPIGRAVSSAALSHPEHNQ